jgi:hypothetical protein
MTYTEVRQKDDLLAETPEIMKGTSAKVLKAVSREWEKRQQTCMDARGEYVEHIIISTIMHSQLAGTRVESYFKRNSPYKDQFASEQVSRSHGKENDDHDLNKGQGPVSNMSPLYSGSPTS